MVKVVWSKRASGQLERNVKYIKDEHGVSYAETVLNKILSSTALLGRTPKMGRVESLLAHRKTEYRFIIVWSYKIIYKVSSDHVTISRVFHTSRNPNKLQGI